jgi:hypothetical protein
MRRNRSRRSLLVGLALTALAPASYAQPDLEGFWTPRLEPERSGQALIEELPEAAVLINDTGAGELAAGDFAGLKLTPAAIAEVRNYDFADELKRENTCNGLTAAFPAGAVPMEIIRATSSSCSRWTFDLVRVSTSTGEYPPATAPTRAAAIRSAAGTATRSSSIRRT